MSADRWSICPKCQKEMIEKENKYWNDLEASYGKIPSEEYSEKQNNPPSFELEETLREDYEIGIDNVKIELYIRFNAECYVCHFKYKYKKDIKIDGTE